jgi:hypothetical protein
MYPVSMYESVYVTAEDFRKGSRVIQGCGTPLELTLRQDSTVFYVREIKAIALSHYKGTMVSLILSEGNAFFATDIAVPDGTILH